jgi:hypothetical protein
MFEIGFIDVSTSILSMKREKIRIRDDRGAPRLFLQRAEMKRTPPRFSPMPFDSLLKIMDENTLINEPGG